MEVEGKQIRGERNCRVGESKVRRRERWRERRKERRREKG
jgi:hypothetical protein